MRKKEKLLGCSEKDKEGKLRRGREVVPEQKWSERGWSTLRVIKSRPSRSPLYPPRLYIPPVHPKSTCIRVCGGENPHNIDVARP
ncbi:hypothetical protein X777_08712 [Ooceraea biroi]|uniref:Uncharacterized protein n=1 Tax=Ooceraea biroi TaxID=2015173 RepID=A0A026WAZ9_OOCBI|nr:hypothetical protein X777_08712 [Ooceraea biroi]